MIAKVDPKTGQTVFESPYDGRTFTNALLYNEHLRRWPTICKKNNWNLDGTPKGSSKSQEEEPQEPRKFINDDMPHGDLLVQNGIYELDDVPTTLAGLQKLEGIGKSKATDILKFLAEAD